MSVLRLEAGDQTEELWQHILADLGDAELDSIGVERVYAPTEGLASEPITAAVVLTLGTTLTIVIARSVEKWIEKKRQAEHMQLVLKAYEISDEAGEALTDIAKKHADISESFGMPKAGDPNLADLLLDFRTGS